MLLQNNSINPPVVQDNVLIPQHDYSVRGACYLTPDALMNYCATRLRGLDNQIQTKFEKQQTANHKVTGGTGVSTDCTIKGAAQALLEAANKVTDPGVQKRLIDLAGKLVHVTGAPPSASFDPNASVALKAQTYKPEEMTQMIAQPVGNLQKDMNSGTELDMIQLQSLMSQRQTAVSTVTQMIQALGEQLNKIAGNIGH